MLYVEKEKKLFVKWKKWRRTYLRRTKTRENEWNISNLGCLSHLDIFNTQPNTRRRILWHLQAHIISEMILIPPNTLNSLKTILKRFTLFQLIQTKQKSFQWKTLFSRKRFWKENKKRRKKEPKKEVNNKRKCNGM